jgi:hypothetical protein
LRDPQSHESWVLWDPEPRMTQFARASTNILNWSTICVTHENTCSAYSE